jgi:hypothetical protein
MVIKCPIKEAIKGGISDCETAKEYLKKVESQFTSSSKTYASTIIKMLVTEKYSFDNEVREHILKKTMDMGLKDGFLVHLVTSSLPKEFEPFGINYNSQPESWVIEKLIPMCVQEEEIINDVRGDFINHMKHNKKKNFSNSPQSKKSYSHDYKTSTSKW